MKSCKERALSSPLHLSTPLVPGKLLPASRTELHCSPEEHTSRRGKRTRILKMQQFGGINSTDPALKYINNIKRAVKATTPCWPGQREGLWVGVIPEVCPNVVHTWVNRHNFCPGCLCTHQQFWFCSLLWPKGSNIDYNIWRKRSIAAVWTEKWINPMHSLIFPFQWGWKLFIKTGSKCESHEPSQGQTCRKL